MMLLNNDAIPPFTAAMHHISAQFQVVKVQQLLLLCLTLLYWSASLKHVLLLRV
jgi:hypothetical protein